MGTITDVDTSGLSLTHSEYRGIRHLPRLDGLRAISVLLVIIVHSRNLDISQWSGGENGLSLFFVISGFLITTLALREESRHGSISLRAFYTRRAFRILPLYYAVLTMYVVLVLLLQLDPRQDGFQWALPYYLAFLQDHVHFVPDTPYLPFEVSWSLGVEEKFYLLWPLLAFVVLAKARRWRVPVAAILAVACVTAGLAVPQGVYVFYYASILCGCIAAILLHDRRTYPLLAWFGTARGLPVAVGIGIAGHVGTYWNGWGAGVLHALLWPCLTVMLVGLVTARPHRARVLDSKPLVAVGVASYAIYLLHLTVLNGVEKFVPQRYGLVGDMTALLLGIAGSIGVSIGVQRYFESPITDFGRRLAARHYGPSTRASKTQMSRPQ